MGELKELLRWKIVEDLDKWAWFSLARAEVSLCVTSEGYYCEVKQWRNKLKALERDHQSEKGKISSMNSKVSYIGLITW